MNCKKCVKLYDNSSNEPQILLPCCHTFCISCLSKLNDKRCPDCGNQIVDMKANFGMLDLIDQNDTRRKGPEMSTQLFQLDFSKKKDEIQNRFNEIESQIINQTNKTMEIVFKNHHKLIRELKDTHNEIEADMEMVLDSVQSLEAKITELKASPLNKQTNEALNTAKLSLNKQIDSLEQITFGVDFKPVDLHQLLAIGSLIDVEPEDNSKKRKRANLELTARVRDLNRKSTDSCQSDSLFSPDNRNLQQSPLTELGTDIHLSRGKACLVSKDYRQALDCFNKGIETNSQNRLGLSVLYYNKALTLHQLNTYKEAVDYFDKAIEINPRDANFYCHKAESLKKLNEHSKSIQCFNILLDLNPENEYLYHFAIGASFIELKEFNKALECFNKVIELKPDYVRVFKNKAFVLFELKEFTRALEWTDKAIEIEPTNLNLFLIKANVYRDMKEMRLAIEWYDKVLNLNPDNFEALKNKKILKSIESN